MPITRNRTITYVIRTEKGSDLVPLYSGREDCLPGHKFGPHIRDHYLIHFCRSGAGTITDKFGTHKVREGDLFIIRPGEVTVYTADETNPWHYFWLAFHGNLSDAFNTDRSVYPCPGELIERIRRLCESEICAPYPYTALLFDLMHSLFSEKETERRQLSAAEKYIEYNYYERDLSIENIASACGYDRSHLYRLFKQVLGVGIKERLTEVRMKHANDFLSKGYSVSETAEMVGYSDPFSFSRAYKKHYGYPPSTFKSKG